MFYFIGFYLYVYICFTYVFGYVSCVQYPQRPVTLEEQNVFLTTELSPHSLHVWLLENIKIV